MRAIARWCVQHRRMALGAWLVGVVVVAFAAASIGSDYKNSFSLKGTQSFEALQLLERSAPKSAGDIEQVVFAVKSGSIADSAARQHAERVLKRLSKLPTVASIASPYAKAGAAQISASKKVAFANVTMTEMAQKFTTTQAKTFTDAVTSSSSQNLTVAVGGQVAESAASNGDSSAGFGALAALIVMFVVFGSALAALLPLVTAGFALAIGVSAVGLLSHLLSMASFSSELALLIGLGVGVDYALFIVTRHRQGLLAGKSVEDAIVDALDTSGRAVLFAGITVCIALLGMFALGVSFLYGVAIAAAIVVAFTVLSALTLLPALLGFLGLRILGRRTRRRLLAGELQTSPGGFWARWSGILSARPAPIALAALVVMAVIAIPFFSLRLGSSDAGSDASGSTTRTAYDLLAQGFGPGYNGPLNVVAQVNSTAERHAFYRVLAVAKTTRGVKSVTAPVSLNGAGDGSSVLSADIYPTGSPQAKSTSSLLSQLRDTVVPRATAGTGARVLIGGQTAIFTDFASVLSKKLPLFIGVVVFLSFLLLAAVFRSLIVPLMAAAMNMLSAGAAFGAVVAVFQWGWLDSVFGISQTGPVEAFVPVMMFAILFGLSMDYQVFLVSRIFEEWHRTRDNTLAVTNGLAATGRTITAAALIMIMVFASFIFGGQVVIKMFGLGLAAAVLMDALIVRMILVPGLMLLIGPRNWWLPNWLDRVLPRLNVEGSVEPEVRVPVPA